jgi:luciferase family oxidoreductase group 1
VNNLIKLSVLDQSLVSAGETVFDAFQNTIVLAKEADKMGFHRFWVSEHHFAKNLAGSSPEILMSHLATLTNTIRIGSGGVMLPHYSAYKVAENFRVLEGLFPNRIDMGLGRAPGGTHLATKALQEYKSTYADKYPQQLDDLITYLYDLADSNFRFPSLFATPKIDTAPEMWLLGSSGGSALLAAERGAGYAFAQFINGEGGADVVKYYRERFRPSIVNEKPHTLLAIIVFCADTDEEAEKLAMSGDLALLLLEKGVTTEGLPTIEEAQVYPYTDFDRNRIAINRKRMVVGSPSTVKKQIELLCDQYETDEVMVVSFMNKREHKIRSYQLLANAFKLTDK